MSDLIDRQDAIEAIYDEMISRFDIGITEAHELAEDVLSGLPSAQPEIIRCEECRWGREACGNIECFADTNVPPEYHGYEWFCPNGERRNDD